MLQTINGIKVEVVEFTTMPELPITGLTDHEASAEKYLSILGSITSPFNRVGVNPNKQGNCAKALTEAIETGVVTEPGKYGIQIIDNGITMNWNIFKIIE